MSRRGAGDQRNHARTGLQSNQHSSPWEPPNREVAAELFLAPNTVEFHLRQINRKLGVRSRGQLAATLAREAAPRASGGPGTLISSRGAHSRH